MHFVAQFCRVLKPELCLKRKPSPRIYGLSPIKFLNRKIESTLFIGERDLEERENGGKKIKKKRERERERETSERDERAREKRTVAIVERPICGPSPHTARACKRPPLCMQLQRRRLESLREREKGPSHFLQTLFFLKTKRFHRHIICFLCAPGPSFRWITSI